ncbi:MAG: methyltransferase domain-containing protein [Xanthobacteraceae bacterium]
MPEADWSRRSAVDVHDETASIFAAEYSSDEVFDSPFRYGRSLIDRAWTQCVAGLPAQARCLDIGCGIGVYMARLLNAGHDVTGIEPSAEMRRLATEHVPAALVSDGSVLDLQFETASHDFVYAIEVFRYLNAADNAAGHREIARVLKPGGTYFGTYVNKWALDGFRQVFALRAAMARMRGAAPRYHAEFETPTTIAEKLRAAGFSQVTVHGAMFAPLRIIYKLAPHLAGRLARRTLPHEEAFSDRPSSRAFAGHLIAVARR